MCYAVAVNTKCYIMIAVVLCVFFPSDLHATFMGSDVVMLVSVAGASLDLTEFCCFHRSTLLHSL